MTFSEGIGISNETTNISIGKEGNFFQMAWFILCFQSDTKGFSTMKTRNGKILGKKYSKTQLKPYLSNEIEDETVKIGKGEEGECHNTVPDFTF